jgi:hypothetical protein
MAEPLTLAEAQARLNQDPAYQRYLAEVASGQRSGFEARHSGGAKHGFDVPEGFFVGRGGQLEEDQGTPWHQWAALAGIVIGPWAIASLAGSGGGAAAGAAAGGGSGAAGAAGSASLLSNILTGLTIAGIALDVIGQLKAGAAQKELAEFNARMAEQRAADAVARGAEDEGRFRAGVRTLIGQQRAGFAAQNVDVGIGSAVDVTADAAFLGELDALTVRNNARREAWGYSVEAENFRRGGSAASSAAKWGAAESILGGATSLLASRYGWGRAA